MTTDQKLPMSQRRYRRTKGARCPFCGGDDVEGGPFTAEAGTAFQELSCNDCDHTWADLYELTGYEDTTE